jgi:hypothetical protein
LIVEALIMMTEVEATNTPRTTRRRSALRLGRALTLMA